MGTMAVDSEKASWLFTMRSAIWRFLYDSRRGFGIVIVAVGGPALSLCVLCWMYSSPILAWSESDIGSVLNDALKQVKSAPNPPWLLLSGLTTAPALLLTWWWRNTDKRQDLANKGTDITHAARCERSARFADGVRLLAEADEGADGKVKSKLAARLGGIYMLEALAKESGNDQQRVIATLCAFVRANGVEIPFTSEQRQPPDVQAAFTVIGRLKCEGVDLRGAKLSHIEGESLHFEHAMFERAHLEGARLSNAHFDKALMVSTYLDGANFGGASLNGADLHHSKLEETWFVEARLSGANLCGCVATNARFDRAFCENTHFDGSVLIGAVLKGSTLTNAAFPHSDLAGVNFNGCDIGTVNLIDSRLEGATLVDAVVTADRLYGAYLSEATKLPPGFDASSIRDRFVAHDSSVTERLSRVRAIVYRPEKYASGVQVPLVGLDLKLGFPNDSALITHPGSSPTGTVLP